jgi:hypothetical protein
VTSDVPQAAEKPSASPAEETRTALADRCDAVEECYEFMLAYAAQGLASDQGSPLGGQVREHLQRCDAALGAIPSLLTNFVGLAAVNPAAPYRAFIAVLDRDAHDAQAAVQLVLAQRFISSQLIDNLNASIHLRALLTDLFLIDEILKTPPHASAPDPGRTVTP